MIGLSDSTHSKGRHSPLAGWFLFGRNSVILSLLVTLFLAISDSVQAAATITAISPSLTDVTRAIASAVDGDTVVVPAGTAHWSTGLSITKGITILGATTIDTSTALGTAKDQTIILDDMTSALVTPPQLINISLSPNQVFRMSGFTFRSGVGTLVNTYVVYVGGTCPGASGTGSFRVDHCHFDNLKRNVDVQHGGWVYGVIDHCIMYGSAFSVIVHHDTWGGGSNGNGDGSWADPPFFGSNKFVFIEDNCFTNVTGSANGGGSSFDAKWGGRAVIRHNFFNNAMISCHGTEGQRPRGCRALEIYNNISNFTFNWPCGQIRSGTAVIHDNASTGLLNGFIFLQPYRAFSNFGQPWTQATGINPWDSNDPHGAYDSGTQTGASSSSALVDSTKKWTNNQWISDSSGCYKAVSSVVNADGSHWSAFITGNSSNTLTLAPGDQPNRTVTFNTGNGYTIYKVAIILDQPGRGASDLITGTTPINSVTGNAAWPHQALEPVYSWNNTIHGGTPSPVGGNATLISGRDYFNDTPMPGYTPYTYPHPLVTGAPAPPTNLRAIP